MKILKIVVAIALMSVLIIFVDWDQLYSVIANVDMYSIAIVFLFYIPSVYVSVCKWHTALLYQQLRYRMSYLFKIYLIGSFFNNFLPTSIGGDFYRHARLTQKNREIREQVFTSILYERFTGLLALAVLNIALSIYFFDFIISHTPLLIIALGTCGLSLGAIGAVCAVRYFPHNQFLARLLRYKVREIKIFTVLSFVVTPKLFFSGMLLSLIFNSIIAVGQYMYFGAFGYTLDPFYILFVSTITQLAALIPLSLNAIGITEGLIIMLYLLVGVPYEVAFAVALITRISLMLASLSGGVAYFYDVLKGDRVSPASDVK
ncbi:MAG: flippase-like domain-containing protein [Candidatus Pacebacteria bacterium]|nr:flippase-like domain-containing protein [Candidatus Paceibacterota bacterium]